MTAKHAARETDVNMEVKDENFDDVKQESGTKSKKYYNNGQGRGRPKIDLLQKFLNQAIRDACIPYPKFRDGCMKFLKNMYKSADAREKLFVSD